MMNDFYGIEPASKDTISEQFLTRIAQTIKVGRKVILSTGPGKDRFALWRQYRLGDPRAWELIDLGDNIAYALTKLYKLVRQP
jgi:hypothetical protein